jgi:hypothetical protein
MVALETVRASNAGLKSLGPGLVAVFGTVTTSMYSYLHWLTNNSFLQLAGLVELARRLPVNLSVTRLLPRCTLWDGINKKQAEFRRN